MAIKDSEKMGLGLLSHGGGNHKPIFHSVLTPGSSCGKAPCPHLHTGASAQLLFQHCSLLAFCGQHSLQLGSSTSAPEEQARLTGMEDWQQPASLSYSSSSTASRQRDLPCDQARLPQVDGSPIGVAPPLRPACQLQAVLLAHCCGPLRLLRLTKLLASRPPSPPCCAPLPCQQEPEMRLACLPAWRPGQRQTGDVLRSTASIPQAADSAPGACWAARAVAGLPRPPQQPVLACRTPRTHPDLSEETSLPAWPD